MRQELTDGQRVLMGELLPVQSYAPPQDPVLVHVHVGNGGGNATSSLSWLGMLGAATIGVIAYSLYQGQPVSATVERIETSLAAAATPQWWDDLKNKWEGKTPPPTKPESVVAESKPSVP